MTFKEKLAMEHPECVGANFEGGCSCCPKDYGYSEDDFGDCGASENGSGKNKCSKCWNREIPNTNKKEKKSMNITPTPRKLNESPTLLEGNYSLIIKGNEILFVDNATGDVANARCHEDDEFFVCNGIDIAFTHLLEKKYGSNYRELQEAFGNVYREE